MRSIFDQSLRVVGALSFASLALVLVPTPGKATPGGIFATTPGDNITMGIQYTSTTAPSAVGVCNPGMSLANGNNFCPTFTAPSYTGLASSFFPNTGNPQQAASPWTSSDTDPSIVVNNNSNYALTKVVYGNVSPTLYPNFLLSDLANSSSDIFGNITYDPTTNELTLASGNKTGVLPGQSWTITRHFIVPQDRVNETIKESAVLTFTPAASAAVPESSSPLAILAVAALGTVSLLNHKSKNS